MSVACRNFGKLLGRARPTVVEETAEEALAISSVVLGVDEVLVPDQVDVTGGDQLHSRSLCEQAEEAEVFRNGTHSPLCWPTMFLRNSGEEERIITERLLWQLE